MYKWQQQSVKRTPMHGDEVEKPPERSIAFQSVTHFSDGARDAEPFVVQLAFETHDQYFDAWKVKGLYNQSQPMFFLDRNYDHFQSLLIFLAKN